jgi:hypothetical protein
MLECYEAISFVARLFLVTKRTIEGAKYVGLKKEKMSCCLGRKRCGVYELYFFILS